MTTNTIQTFIIPEQIGTGFIRSVAIDGRSYFVGKDIAEALASWWKAVALHLTEQLRYIGDQFDLCADKDDAGENE